MYSKYVVIALHRPIINLCTLACSQLYHFTIEQIIALTSRNMACTKAQRDFPELHQTILEQICLKNQIPEAKIPTLLTSTQN